MLLLVSLETCEYIVLHVTGFTIVRVILVYRTVYLNVSVCEATKSTRETTYTRVENATEDYQIISSARRRWQGPSSGRAQPGADIRR